jgi:hypothetical protein
MMTYSEVVARGPPSMYSYDTQEQQQLYAKHNAIMLFTMEKQMMIGQLPNFEEFFHRVYFPQVHGSLMQLIHERNISEMEQLQLIIACNYIYKLYIATGVY